MARKSVHADRVCEELRDSLTRGEVPLGRLVEQQLAERFRTSRTPIRDALRRLEGDGHLTRDAASGYVRARVQRGAAVVREQIGELLSRMFEESAAA